MFRPAAKHDARRLGIDPDVVFGRRRDVALAARRAAHDDAAADLAGKTGIARERQRDIGQRPERHQRQAGAFAGEAQDRVDRMLALGRATRSGKAAIRKTIFAMKPMGVTMRPRERSGGAGKDGNLDPGDFGGQKRVARSLIDADIARDRGQAQHAHVGRGKRHQDRDRVVGGGVGVDEEIAHLGGRAPGEKGAP